MEQRTARYVLVGEPATLIRIKSEETFRGWDNQRQSRTIASISLQSQHGDQSLFAGPVALEITFFFKRPLKTRDGWRTWHLKEPSLIYLLSFMQDACRGTVYNQNCSISAISMKKMYDEEPHTEIIIHELTKYDSNRVNETGQIKAKNLPS